MGHVAPSVPQVSASHLFSFLSFYWCSPECVNRTLGCLGDEEEGKGRKEKGGEGDQGKKKEGEGGKYSLSCLFNYHTMIVFSYK